MIFPMYVMFLLVVITAAILFLSRFKAIRSRAVSIKYYRAMTGPDSIPDYTAVPTRQFINLFELPLLFYAVCLASMIMQVNGPVMVGLAWAFVFCRYVQAFIHLTYNNVIHRAFTYFLGMAVLFVMWTLLVVWAT